MITNVVIAYHKKKKKKKGTLQFYFKFPHLNKCNLSIIFKKIIIINVIFFFSYTRNMYIIFHFARFLYRIYTEVNKIINYLL